MSSYLADLSEEAYKLKAQAEEAYQEGNLQKAIEILGEAKVKVQEISDYSEELFIDLEDLEQEIEETLEENSISVEGDED